MADPDARPRDSATREPDDDMHDPADRAASFPLGAFLTLCDPGPAAQPCLRKDFEDTDEKAKRAQTAYGKVVQRAALIGVGALLIGLAQRLFAPHAGVAEAVEDPLLPLDFVYTLIALLFVLAALLTGRQEHWLSERFKAERLRLMKFRLLIDPKMWQPERTDLAPWAKRLETGRRVIVNQSEDLLEALKLSDSLPDLSATQDCQAVEPPALQRLLEYYRRKRLTAQLEYFEGKARQKMRLANPRLPPIFFFAGITLVLCNDILLWATNGTRAARAESVSLVLVLLSFAVPMGWSAIRTLRGATEFSRNTARSRARHSSLSEISHGLDAATDAPPERWDRPLIFGYLTLCEGILAADQHEWIRLMKDAEWHG